LAQKCPIGTTALFEIQQSPRASAALCGPQIECGDEQDAEVVEARAVAALERIAQDRVV
jgi:hypothetical protein